MRHFEGAIIHVLTPIFTTIASPRDVDDEDHVIPNPVEKHTRIAMPSSREGFADAKSDIRLFWRATG